MSDQNGMIPRLAEIAVLIIFAADSGRCNFKRRSDILLLYVFIAIAAQKLI